MPALLGTPQVACQWTLPPWDELADQPSVKYGDLDFAVFAERGVTDPHHETDWKDRHIVRGWFYTSGGHEATAYRAIEEAKQGGFYVDSHRDSEDNTWGLIIDADKAPAAAPEAPAATPYRLKTYQSGASRTIEVLGGVPMRKLLVIMGELLGLLSEQAHEFEIPAERFGWYVRDGEAVVNMEAWPEGEAFGDWFHRWASRNAIQIID